MKKIVVILFWIFAAIGLVISTIATIGAIRNTKKVGEWFKQIPSLLKKDK